MGIRHKSTHEESKSFGPVVEPNQDVAVHQVIQSGATGFFMERVAVWDQVHSRDRREHKDVMFAHLFEHSYCMAGFSQRNVLGIIKFQHIAVVITFFVLIST